jgi:predicted nucleic acid-binding protein
MIMNENDKIHSVYIETSIPSYLTARPSSDLRVAAWQQLTTQWWEESRHDFHIYTSELVLTEVSAGNLEAAKRRIQIIKDINRLIIDDEVKNLAAQLVHEKAVPSSANADAIHIAVAAVHRIDYLLTWNFRHIDNAAKKPAMRIVCSTLGYRCPEICTPLELIGGDIDNV